MLLQIPKGKANAMTKATMTASVTPTKKEHVKIGTAPVKTRTSIHPTLHLTAILMKIPSRRMTTITLKKIQNLTQKQSINSFQTKSK